MLIPIFIHEPDHRNRSNSFSLQFVCRMRSACLPSALRSDIQLIVLRMRMRMGLGFGLAWLGDFFYCSTTTTTMSGHSKLKQHSI